MLFHFSLFLYSLFFSFALAVTAKYGNNFVFYLWALVVILLFTFRAVRSFARDLKRTLFIPLLLAASSTVLLAFVNTVSEQRIFIVLAAFAYYTALLGTYRLTRVPQDVTARALMAMNAMIALFFYLSALYGLYINFTVPLWLFMIAYGVAAMGVLSQYLRILTDNRRQTTLFSLIGALSLAELAWVVNFWPFGYLTSGVVVLMFFFVLFDLAQSEILHTLSKQRTIAHLAIFTLLMILVLWSSRWLPVA